MTRGEPKRKLWGLWAKPTLLLVGALVVLAGCQDEPPAPPAEPAGEPSPAGAAEETAQAPPGHFHPKGKPPSEHTLKVLEKERATLPFSDERDFEEAKKGFIAKPDSLVIKGEAGAETSA